MPILKKIFSLFKGSGNMPLKKLFSREKDEPPHGTSHIEILDYRLSSEHLTSEQRQRVLEISRQIVNGDVSEYAGAKTIWHEIVDSLDRIPDELRLLWLFKARASLIEDCIVDTKEWGSDHADLIDKTKREISEFSEKIIEAAESSDADGAN